MPLPAPHRTSEDLAGPRLGRAPSLQLSKAEADGLGFIGELHVYYEVSHLNRFGLLPLHFLWDCGEPRSGLGLHGRVVMNAVTIGLVASGDLGWDTPRCDEMHISA